MTLDKKLNDAFEEMMKYRQSIGYATATYRSSVPPFINFCVKNYPLSARITQEMVDEWLTYYPYTVNSKAAFISLLREYTKYLNFLGYDDYIPDDDYVVKRIAFNPYLFTDDELSGLFKTIDSYVGKTCGKRRLYTAVQEAQGSAHHYVRGYARSLSEIRFRSRKEAMVLSKMGRHTI